MKNVCWHEFGSRLWIWFPNSSRGFEISFWTKNLGYITFRPWQISGKPLCIRRFRFWISPIQDIDYCTFAVGGGIDKYAKFAARFRRKELGIYPKFYEPDVFKLNAFLRIKIRRQWEDILRNKNSKKTREGK